MRTSWHHSLQGSPKPLYHLHSYIATVSYRGWGALGFPTPGSSLLTSAICLYYFPTQDRHFPYLAISKFMILYETLIAVSVELCTSHCSFVCNGSHDGGF